VLLGVFQPPRGGDSDVAVAVGSPGVVDDVLEEAGEPAGAASAASDAAELAALSAADSRRFRSSSPS